MVIGEYQLRRKGGEEKNFLTNWRGGLEGKTTTKVNWVSNVDFKKRCGLSRADNSGLFL